MNKSVVEIEGFDVLQRKITLLADDRDKQREVKAILRRVARPTVKAAQGFAPQSKKPHRARKTLINPGNLKKSIGTITGRKGNSKKNPTIYVGPRVRGKYDGFYGAWVHEGVNIYRKGFKRNRKGNRDYNAAGAASRTKAQPFMDKAYNVTKGKVTADAEKSVAAFIQKRINKLSA